MRLSIYRRAVLKNDNDRKGAVVSLDAAAHRIISGEKGLDKHTAMLRQHLKNGRQKRYKRDKETKTIAATFSGTFSIRSADVALADKFTEHNGLLTFDIDKIFDENKIESLKTHLSFHPNVTLIFTSPSNTGVKAILRVDPIPTTQNDDEHKHVWRLYKKQLDEMLQQYNVQCDSGDDPTRLCFLCHDPKAYYDPNAEAGLWDREAYHTESKQRERQRDNRIKKERKSLESRDWSKDEIDKSALSYVDPNLEYNDWLVVLIVCKKQGFTMHEMIAWSKGGSKYVEGDVKKRWDKLGTPTQKKEATWGSVVYFAKQNGYQLPQKKRQSKLQSANSQPVEVPPEQPVKRETDAHTNLESLEVSDERRAQAADTFFKADTGNSLHIMLVKEGTGKGKSHTFLTKSKQHGKRTLANPPHTELAAQAVETARQQGYENPFHILGREHNWDASGIADIPPDERTGDLFANNNCIMVDQIKAYTDKRLAPRTYCEHTCRFRDECLHMAQYEGLSERDFIASCTPNLLFDLNMRGYLESLVTATDEVSDTDLAMDAILGTESKEMPEFNFAILDDYTVSSLYTDVVFSQSEFKTLKTAWKGTPTSEFAKLVLKAFEKKKPSKIVKALRKAFESTADNHEQIAKSLTQHARIGKIEYADVPKSSAESKRLLSEKVIRYTDNGLQSIAVDFEAYQELKEKGIPCVHPQHISTDAVGEQVCVGHSPVSAIQSGVKVKDLTPIWQSTATPITLLRIFLDSLGDERHAPIRRTFRTGDTPIAILTFSIPPQAPVGVIPQIAMLSATSQIDDTKRPFLGQAVTFSEHDSPDSQWAKGVEVYQFQDSRLTSGSIFEYETDDDGKRILQSEPTGLTTTAERRIGKLNEWAKSIDGLTAFISYKEFTESFKSHVDGFDEVAHFDTIAGLNLDGLKFLVVFGYPKVKHEVVMTHASKQFASDHKRLPKGDKSLRDENDNPISEYHQLTETDTYTENGLTITERRYKDPRLEKIRLQLSIEKLEQAMGRARVPRWTNTTSMLITNAPISTTPRATLFNDAAFNIATSPRDLPDAARRIIDAEKSGDVKAVMETTGVSKRTAERRTQPARINTKVERDNRIIELHKEGKSTREIERLMKADRLKVSYPTISRVIKVFQKRQDLKDILIGDVANETPTENADDTGIQSDLPPENSNGHHPVPRSEYSKLTECVARVELEYCNDTHNYTGAAYLRGLFRQKGWKINTQSIHQRASRENDMCVP